MASTGTVIPYLFMPCCRRDRTDSLMNEGVGLTHEPVNSFVASETASTTTQRLVREEEPTFSQSFAFLFWVQWNSSLFKTISFQILWQFSPNSPDFKKPLHSHIVKMQLLVFFLTSLWHLNTFSKCKNYQIPCRSSWISQSCNIKKIFTTVTSVQPLWG